MTGAALLAGLLLAWLAYRAGTGTERARTTWADHRHYRGKARRLRWVRWAQAGAAGGWLLTLLVAVGWLLAATGR